MEKLIVVIGQVVMLLALVVALTVAFVGVLPVVLLVASPSFCIMVAVSAASAAFMLLIGNHREEGPDNSYELSVLLKDKIAKGEYTVVKGVFTGERLF